jgi:AsmA family
MNESPTSAPRSGKRRRWLRFVVKFFGVLILLLIVAWFVVTSSVFFKSFILPRVSKAANATVTVDEAVISPFSHVILRNLKVQTTGAEPLVTAAEVRIRYHLVDILCGNFNVDEVALVSPTINLVENPDGTSNLDPLLKSQSKEKKSASPAKNSKSSKPFHVDLKKFTLTEATIREIKNFSGGQSDMTEVSNVNISLDNVKNGGSGKLQLSADAKIDNNPPTPAAKGNLQANVAGNFTFTLADDLKPLSVQGSTRLDVTQAGGAIQDLKALGMNFDCEITPTNITQIALHFQKAGAQLGALQVSGPFDVEKTEGRLNVEILGLDRRVLNLFGAASGIDFGGTTINSMNHIELAKSGSVITAAGQFTVAGLQVTRAGRSTPTLDATADYNVTVDRTAQTALLNTLTLTATQNRNPLAHAELSSPMNICWGDTNASGGDATLNLAITGLNLADWKPFLGETISGGNVDFNAKLASQSGGKQLAFDIGSQITNLTANFGGNRISQAGIDLRVRGQAADFKRFKWDECRLQVARENQPLLTVSATGTCEPATQNTDLQVQLQTALPDLLKLLPQAGANLSSGAVEVTAHVTQKEQMQTVTGTLALTALTGSVGKNEFNNFGVSANLDATNSAGQIQISRLDGQLTGNGINGGNFQISGNYDLDKKSGQLTAKLAGFNENGLRPFLEPLLGDKKLVSVAINANADAQFDLQNNDAVKADLQVTNLVVNDPAGKFPATPLEAKVQLDASVNKQVADIRQFQIMLTPTERAKNELQLAGKVDFSKTNAIAGNIKLTADAMDVTRYYDLFANQQSKPVATAPPQTAATSTVATNLNLEPAAMNLPFGKLTVDTAIGQFYLDEVDVSNLQATVKLNGSRVSLTPFKLFLNGAPVNATADLNLGVPGYQYNVSANADRIPIAPLADTFSPAYKNKAKGDLLVNVQVKGAGITGASMQKNLSGDVGLVITNADIQLVGPKIKAFVADIARVAMVAHISGMSTLTNAALNRLDVRLQMGNGKIALTRCLALASAFRVIITGELPIAPVLNDSPFNDWPIHIAIGNGSAQNPDAMSNVGYARLPNFVGLGGTLGDPKPVDLLLKEGTKAVTTATSKVKNWLEKHTSSSENSETNDSGTNAPPAKKSKPIQHLLNLFK